MKLDIEHGRYFLSNLFLRISNNYVMNLTLH